MHVHWKSHFYCSLLRGCNYKTSVENRQVSWILCAYWKIVQFSLSVTTAESWRYIPSLIQMCNPRYATSKVDLMFYHSFPSVSWLQVWKSEWGKKLLFLLRSHTTSSCQRIFNISLGLGWKVYRDAKIVTAQLPSFIGWPCALWVWLMFTIEFFSWNHWKFLMKCLSNWDYLCSR